MNQAYTSYGAGSSYRRLLAARAAERGAVAALVRSVTPFSLSTVHTGTSDTASIPAAAITIETAEMLKRMQSRGQEITLSLTMYVTFWRRFHLSLPPPRDPIYAVLRFSVGLSECVLRFSVGLSECVVPTHHTIFDDLQ